MAAVGYVFEQEEQNSQHSQGIIRWSLTSNLYNAFEKVEIR